MSTRNLITARLLACLFSAVRGDDAQFQEMAIFAGSILEYTGGSDYKTLKIACDKLAASVLEENNSYYNSDYGNLENIKDGNGCKYTIFSTIRYEDGVIFAKFHPDMTPFLLGLKSNFTKYELKEFLRLPSVYSQKLFEYLKSWGDCVERIEDIGTICSMLAVPGYLYANFKDFRIRVLDKAHRDISALTSFHYEWEAMRKGTGKTSPVTGLRFVFSPGGRVKSMKSRKEARNKEVRDERNRLFLESMKCFTNKPDCVCPKITGQCAVCFKARAMELPDNLQGQLPEYE